MQLYLFGAGASYGSGDCIPFPPPLGSRLFEKLVPFSPTLQSLSADLAELFSRDGFEAGMGEFTRTRPGDRAALLREMAKYFLQFEPGKNNTYRKLIRHLKVAGVEAVFATLNYEMLIELSACDEGYDEIAYHKTANSDAFRILKLHGSSNFMPDIGKSTLQNIKWGNSARHLGAPVQPVSWPDAKKAWSRENSLAPAMSLYSAGKEVLFSDGFVVQQQEDWRGLCGAATDVFIIGVRVWPSDRHIWEPIAEAPGIARYVGGEHRAFQEWSSAHRKGPAEIVARTFAEFVTKAHPKVGRNEPCPCRSGKKYKKCHGAVTS